MFIKSVRKTSTAEVKNFAFPHVSIHEELNPIFALEKIETTNMVMVTVLIRSYITLHHIVVEY